MSVCILVLHSRVHSTIVSHASEAPPTWCCHDGRCSSPLSARAVLTTTFPPSPVVHSGGKALVLKSGHVWLQLTSRPKVQDFSSAHQGVCGESSLSHSGKPWQTLHNIIIILSVGKYWSKLKGLKNPTLKKWRQNSLVCNGERMDQNNTYTVIMLLIKRFIAYTHWVSVSLIMEILNAFFPS